MAKSQKANLHSVPTVGRRRCQQPTYSISKRKSSSRKDNIDYKGCLFFIIIIVDLTIGVISFWKTGSTAMLYTLLPYGAVYAGLPQVNDLVQKIKER